MALEKTCRHFEIYISCAGKTNFNNLLHRKFSFLVSFFIGKVHY